MLACLPIHLTVCWSMSSVCLIVELTICLVVCLLVRFFICLSVCRIPDNYPFVHLDVSVCLPLSLFLYSTYCLIACLLFRLSICLLVNLIARLLDYSPLVCVSIFYVCPLVFWESVVCLSAWRSTHRIALLIIWLSVCWCLSGCLLISI